VGSWDEASQTCTSGVGTDDNGSTVRNLRFYGLDGLARSVALQMQATHVVVVLPPREPRVVGGATDIAVVAAGPVS